jgi:hypothetical protein
MKKTVLIRGIDEEGYRKAKAAAAMKELAASLRSGRP